MRRTLLALCAALGLAGLLWLAAPALSLGPSTPATVDFELAVRAPAGARAAGTRWTSPVLRAPKRFDLLGLRWAADGPEHVHAEVRVRRDGARWSAWTEMPDADTGSVRGTDPVWTGGADELQLRLRRRPAGLRIHFVNATGTATPGARRVSAARAAVASVARTAARLAGAATARAAGEQPPIVPRAEWDGGQCAPRRGPSTGSVQMAFVHHTVGTNDYGPEQSRAIVLAICRFHRNGNGWDDIGYPFLVDKYGTIFEGRAGGIDQPVVGAHAQGFNAVSTGVANLGTHGDAPQSDAAIDAISRLLAWKLPLHGVPVTGPVTVTSAGGSTNRHPSGRAVTFERIAGHRDANATDCPGAALYAQLPRLRELADARAPRIIAPPPGPAPLAAPAPAPPVAAPASLSLDAEATRLAFPVPARLRGRMADSAGGPVAGAPVAVQILTGSGFRTAARATTAGDGTWSAELPTARNRVVRAVRDARDGPRIPSRQVRLTVAPALTVTAPRRVQTGRRLVVAGTVFPRKASVVVSATRQGATGGFGARVARVRAPVRSGRFRLALPLRTPGVYRVSVAYAGDRTSAPSRAPDVFARVTRGPVRAVGGGAQAAP